jgi:hypothetical protein
VHMRLQYQLLMHIKVSGRASYACSDASVSDSVAPNLTFRLTEAFVCAYKAPILTSNTLKLIVEPHTQQCLSVQFEMQQRQYGMCVIVAVLQIDLHH